MSIHILCSESQGAAIVTRTPREYSRGGGVFLESSGKNTFRTDIPRGGQADSVLWLCSAYQDKDLKNSAEFIATVECNFIIQYWAHIE